MRLAINIGVSVLILVIGGVYFTVFGQKQEIEKKEGIKQPGALVETTVIRAYNDPLIIQLDGEASTYRVITISAEVTGKVVEKPVKIRGGNFIEKGEVLFQIDPLTYQLQIDQLNAQIEQITAEQAAIKIDLTNTADLIVLAKEDLKLQQSLLSRTRSLFERKASTESALETAMQQEIAVRNSIQKLENQSRTLDQSIVTKAASLKLVQSQLERAKVDLARCTIVSPIAGRLVDDPIEQGNYVRPGDAMVHISDASKMEVKCQMLAEELAWVWQQQLAAARNMETPPEASNDPIRIITPIPCEVVYEFEGAETIWDGFLDRYEGTGIDRETRTFPCRVLVENPRQTRVNRSPGGRAAVTPPTLLSGMYVTVRIPVESSIPLLQVPLEAVRPGGTVWLIKQDTLLIVDVSVAKSLGDIALVRQGSAIEEGDQVVTSPLASVASGMLVREGDATSTALKTEGPQQ